MRFKLKVGIDVDDVLYKCSEYAIALANLEKDINPPILLSEVDAWGKTGRRTDVIFEYFAKPAFYELQPIYDGAKEFIRSLTKRAEVFFITAVAPEMMSIRAKRLLQDFPEIPAEHIIIGTRKDLVDVDILLDDGQHNILASKNAYPVLMRRPWNHSMTGCLSVNTYAEFLALVDTILGSFQPKRFEGNGKIVVLVGPSASGKTLLIEEAEKNGLAKRVVSTTTRTKRPGEAEGAYYYVDMDQFLSMEQSGTFLETTRYASEGYGTTKDAFEEVLAAGQNAICAMDICGAVAVKKAFPDNAILAFVDRPKEDILDAILDRDIPKEEKKKRILSLSDEYRNEEICDAVIRNHSTTSNAYAQLENIVRKEEEIWDSTTKS